MKDAQENLLAYQDQLKVTLREMEEQHYPNEVQDLQSDANRTLNKLRREQNVLEDARKKAEVTERELRAKAKHFVWIDRPASPHSDWIALFVFTVALLGLSYAQLVRKDKQLLAL
jgi:hypothetical protein